MLSKRFSLLHRRLQIPKDEDSSGFASAQFIGLMALSVFMLSTFVNIFLIEYIRSASFTSVRDAARAGTQVVDLGRAIDAGKEDEAINACEQRLQESISDLFNATSSGYEYDCEIIQDDSSGSNRYSMKATLEPKAVYVVPWARAFRGRLKNISATYEQKQNANPGSAEDPEDTTPECDFDDESCTP